MAQRKSIGEFDTDEVKAINKYIADAPSYFDKTEKIYHKVFGNGEPGMDEDIRNLGKDMKEALDLLRASKPMETKQKVDDLFAMGKTITISVAIFLITSGLGLLAALIRLAPYLKDLETLLRTTSAK
jgi:hypothetical protein